MMTSTAPAGALADIARLLENAEYPQVRVHRVLELVQVLLACDRCALATLHDGDVPALSTEPESAALNAGLRAKVHDLLAIVSDRPSGHGDRTPITGTGDGGNHLAVPLVAEDHVSGLLLIERDTSAFDEHDLQLLVIVGANLGAYLANLRLREQEARATADRLKLIEELQIAIRLSELFMGIVGHDLRSPLAAISTSAEVLMRSCDERMLRPLQRISGNVKRMTEIIDQLLDFTRVRLGKGLELSPAPQDLMAVCRRVLEEIQDGHPAIELTLSSCGHTGACCDAARIGQAVSNLLGNAIEHGMPGRPVAVTVTGTDDKLLIISVHNEGTISDEVRATLFDPFQRAQRKDRPRTGGLGLGLYVSERIATAHDGAIAVDSSPEHGTTFSIRLPRCASGAQHR